MKRELSISMMCVDFGNLNHTLAVYKSAGVDYLHIDVMDGHFVPNLMLGTSYTGWLRRNTDIALDIHLMAEDPISKLEWFDIQPGDIVSVHVEAAWHILDALDYIKKRGAKALVAISPQTTVESLAYLLDYADGVLVMLVVPGFSGQTMIRGMDDKVRKLLAYKANRDDFRIEVDGHVTKENILQLEKLGADIFVAGTSYFGESKTADYENLIKKFYEM